MADRPGVPREWGLGYISDIEDQYGQREWSGYLMPDKHAPAYDAGGWGAETASLREDPAMDSATRLSRSLGLSSAALSAPGLWKLLTVPAAAPFVGHDLLNVHRNMQQLDGTHPTMQRQDSWAGIIERILRDK